MRTTVVFTEMILNGRACISMVHTKDTGSRNFSETDAYIFEIRQQLGLLDDPPPGYRYVLYFIH